MTQYNSVQNVITRYDSLRYGTTRHKSVRIGTTRYFSLELQADMTRPALVKLGLTENDSVRNVTRYDALSNGTTRHKSVRFGTTRYFSVKLQIRLVRSWHGSE